MRILEKKVDFLDNMFLFNHNPNFEYLLKNLNGNYLKIFSSPSGDNNMLLHENGWLEVSLDMDEENIKKNITKKINIYEEEYLPRYKYSERRFSKLKEIITYLNDYGNVFLVRLPIHQDLFQLEKILMPDFNKKINDLDPLVLKYIDLTSKNKLYQYTDGNHLYKTSGAQVTKEIVDSIRNYLN